MLKQKINSILAMILLGSVALGASFIILRVAEVDDFGGSGAISVFLSESL